MLKRGLTILLLVLIGLALAAGGGLASLDLTAPYLPGDALFPLQSWVEQTRLVMIANPADRAARRIDLVERRLHNLRARSGMPFELVALQETNKAFDLAVVAVDAGPVGARAPLLVRLGLLAADYQSVLKQLTRVPASDPAAYAQALDKASGLQGSIASAQGGSSTVAASAPDIVPAAPTPTQIVSAVIIVPIAAHGVPFPPNSTPGSHDLYPLSGKHAAIPCASCHAQDRYRGTPRDCESCHVKDRPSTHFPGACDTCHTTEAWKPAHFDHATSGSRDCADCHLSQQPANHFGAPCASCHTDTTNWKNEHFDHSRVSGQDCSTCHLSQQPANHFGAPCASCHTDTTNWKNEHFDHSRVSGQDCSACHLGQQPANHFGAPCASCHTDTTNWKNEHFDHSRASGQDCSTCHLSQQPANHFGAPCATCHADTTNWQNASFDHSRAGGHDCSECHLSQQPANHYGAPCASCHTDTTNWKNASFDHSRINGQDCSACHMSQEPANHFGAPCATCHHDTGNWQNASFDHSRAGGHDCSECHLSQQPANHFGAPCATCHTDTTNWQNATFTHPVSFSINHGGANGQCVTCHPGNNYAAYSCTGCHNVNDMSDKHKDVSGYSPSTCYDCHKNSGGG